MLFKNSQLLTKLSIRINHPISQEPIGSGILYKHLTLDDRIYVFTAAHCLYEDRDKFKIPLESVSISIFSHESKNYQELVVKIDHRLVSPNLDGDVAVITVDAEKIESITGSLPSVKVIKDRLQVTTFASKGFPSATKGRELIMIEPKWVQDLETSNKFQLYLDQDFSTTDSARYEVDGFSGSGVFLHKDDDIYLFGIFTRFLEAGKIIYCEYVTTINRLLSDNYLPLIELTFLGPFGLTHQFFQLNAEKSVKNLGTRFSEELNFKLPISDRFNEIAKDEVFRQRLVRTIDEYLTAPSYHQGGFDLLKEIDNAEKEFLSFLTNWITRSHWQPGEIIDAKELFEEAEKVAVMLEDRLDELFRLRYEHPKTEGEIPGSDREPFQGEMSRVRELQSNLRKFMHGLSKINIELSNNPVLLIKGEAGTGKSHLLGDVISNLAQNQKPGILLLGQHFKSEMSVWPNILQQLGLGCSKDEFLSGLNDVGKQIGSRALLLIDAINEGVGKPLWKSEIAGFLHEVSKYPYVGVVISIRTTYYNSIIPKNLREDKSILKIDHQGFKGNEYKALKVFCNHYGIHQPNFPILAPEYTNPLFLQLICIGVLATEEKIFPQGFQGLSKILNYYLRALYNRLSERNSDYSLHPKLLNIVVQEFSQFVYKSPNPVLFLEEAVNFFDEKFPKFPRLLEELIEEGFFIRSLYQLDRDSDQEVLYFSYERLGDFFIAERLLIDYQTKDEVLVAFQKDDVLGSLHEGYSWSNRGILEAMAIILPEKYELEIVEVFKWVFEQPEDMSSNLGDWLNQWLIDSLKWRKISSIDEKKIIEWFNSSFFQVQDGNLFYFLVELTTIKGHPFNGDKLHKVLIGHPMAQRDGFWQRHMHGYHGLDDSEIAFPITRLIEWGWEEGISEKTDDETARLVGQTLAWVLSSTNRGLRDQATKSLVNLLQDRPKALINVMDAFKEIDDLYIAERLFAVAYGVALRSKQDKQLKYIAQYVFDLVFKDGVPIPHILLRDYARNSIEYAISRDIQLVGDMSLIRPPYGSKLPEKFPTSEDVEKLKMNEGEESANFDQARINNQVHFSVLSWDFGRYTIDSALRHFHPVRFTYKQDYDAFYMGLKRGGKTLIKEIVKYYEFSKIDDQSKRKYHHVLKDKERFWKFFSELHLQNEEKLLSLLDDKQTNFYWSEIIPWLETSLDIKFRRNNGFIQIDAVKIKNWIVQRVFDLGYNVEIHGSHDSSNRDRDYRTDSKVERIGKKYQWIAFFEILAILTDNYKLKDNWNDSGKSYHYSGPWELMIRDIDPSFTYKNDFEELKEDEFGILQKPKNWYSKERYEYWDRGSFEWAESLEDLPSRLHSILKVDEDGNEWVYLKASFSWREPKQVGKEKYGGSRKEVWYMFQGYLIPQAKTHHTVAWLKKQNFFDRWLPENPTYTDLFTRENFWSPISKQNQKQVQEWELLEDSPFKVMLSTETAVGELSGDKSGAHFDFLMPCKQLYCGLNLRFASKDGEFENAFGEITATNESPHGLMIRKDKLIEYLDANKLSIIWTLLGEKNAFNERKTNQDFRKSLSGVYHFEHAKLKEHLSVNDW